MNTREIAVEYRLAHWAQIMKERLSSGKTIREFCASAGYNEHVYYYWQRRLREAACQELVSATQDIRQGASTPSGWVACVKPETKASSPLKIEIGQYRVLVDPCVNADELAKVCRVLASIC